MIAKNEEEASFYCVVLEGRPLSLWSQITLKCVLYICNAIYKVAASQTSWEEVITKNLQNEKKFENLQKKEEVGTLNLFFFFFSAFFSWFLHVLLIYLSHLPSPYASYFVLSSKKLEPKVKSRGRCTLLIVFSPFFFFWVWVLPPPCHGALSIFNALSLLDTTTSMYSAKARVGRGRGSCTE